MPGKLFVQGRKWAAQGTPRKRTTLVQKGKLAYLQPVPRGMLFYPRSGCVFSFGLAGRLPFLASGMTDRVYRCDWWWQGFGGMLAFFLQQAAWQSRWQVAARCMEPAPERYTGGSSLARRRGRSRWNSPCRYSGRAICRSLVSVGLFWSAFLRKRRAGTRFLPSFLQKACQPGSWSKRARLTGLGGIVGWWVLWVDFCLYRILHSQHGAKALPLLAVRECSATLSFPVAWWDAVGGSLWKAKAGYRQWALCCHSKMWLAR